MDGNLIELESSAGSIQDEDFFIDVDNFEGLSSRRVATFSESGGVAVETTNALE